MGDLASIAFDIETSGLEPGAVITVAGLAFELGEVILLNTAHRPVDVAELEARLSRHSAGRVDLKACQDEHALLTTLAEVSTEQINTDAHYLTAYHGETWNGGFDLPFLRTACVDRSVPWPFPDMAYADMLDVVDRFETDETHESGSPQPFLTNLEVSDEIALDRRAARKRIEKYSDRGAIETSYSSIKDIAAWTTSKEIEVRWFHFAFGCIVYNMWLLVDFLTQERIGVIETRKKPRITLSRFLEWLDKELVTLM